MKNALFIRTPKDATKKAELEKKHGITLKNRSYICKGPCKEAIQNQIAINPNMPGPSIF